MKTYTISVSHEACEAVCIPLWSLGRPPADTYIFAARDYLPIPGLMELMEEQAGYLVPEGMYYIIEEHNE